MTRAFVDRTIRDCVCATCWGRIDEVCKDGERSIRCMNPDCNGSGFVTKYYAQNRREQSEHEAIELRHDLRRYGVIDNPNAGKSQLFHSKPTGNCS